MSFRIGSKFELRPFKILFSSQCHIDISLFLMARRCSAKQLTLAFPTSWGEFSVQATHVHLTVEAESREALSRGLRSFSVSLARQVNRLLFRRGALVAARWHEHALTTPRAVRHALAYLFDNARKHGESVVQLDGLSSAIYFRSLRGFTPAAPCEVEPHWVPAFDAGDRWRRELNLERGLATPVAAARSWLLKMGWQHRRPNQSR